MPISDHAVPRLARPRSTSFFIERQKILKKLIAASKLPAPKLPAPIQPNRKVKCEIAYFSSVGKLINKSIEQNL